MVLHNRLSGTTRLLRSWMANDIILRLDIAQESRALTLQELDLRKELKTRVLGWAAVERSRRRQSSRLIQIKEGDACTNFFHQKASSTRQRNLIAYLKTDVGSIIWNHSEKEETLAKYFTEILGCKIQREASLDWDSLELSMVQDPSMDRHLQKMKSRTQSEKCRVRRLPAQMVSRGLFTKSAGRLLKVISWQPSNVSTSSMLDR